MRIVQDNSNRNMVSPEEIDPNGLKGACARRSQRSRRELGPNLDGRSQDRRWLGPARSLALLGPNRSAGAVCSPREAVGHRCLSGAGAVELAARDPALANPAARFGYC